MTWALNSAAGGFSDSGGAAVSSISNSGSVTTGANALVYFTVQISNASTITVSSVTDTAGLSWTKRGESTVTTNGKQVTTSLWYAFATSSVSTQATAHLSGAASTAVVCINCFSGANSTTPLDISGNFPKFNSGSSGTPTSGAASTSLSGAASISGMMSNKSGSEVVSGSGQTAILQNRETVWDYEIQWNSAVSGSVTSAFSGTATGWMAFEDVMSATLQVTNVTGTVTTNLTKANISAAGWTTIKGSATTALTKFSQSASGTGNTTITENSASGGFSDFGGSSVTSIQSQNPITTGTNALAYLVVYLSDPSASRTVSSVTDTAGLTWNFRGRSQQTIGSSHVTTELWYATTASSVSTQATANLSGSTATAVCGLVAFDGVNITTPLDISGNFPVFNFANGTNSTPSAGPASTSLSAAATVSGMMSNKSGSQVRSGSGQTDILDNRENVWDYEIQWLTPVSAGSITSSFTGSATGWMAFEDVLSTTRQIQGINATIKTNLSGISQSASGVKSAGSHTGTITTTLTKPSQSLSAKETFTGTITTTLKAPSQSASGELISNIGTVTTRLSKMSQALAGIESNTGTITTNLKPPTQQANGWTTVTGTIVTAMPAHAFHLLAQTFEVFTGTITTNLGGESGQLFATIGQAKEIFTGTITTRLGDISQLLEGTVIVTGTITTHLGETVNGAFGNVVHGLEIIQGPIVTNLPPLSQWSLGAQLAAPNGEYKTWRYTDS